MMRTAELARTNAECARLLVDLEAKSREPERLSLRDSVTGLNRRDFDRQLDSWLRDSARQHATLAVAMFDIDHFSSRSMTGTVTRSAMKSSRRPPY